MIIIVLLRWPHRPIARCVQLMAFALAVFSAVAPAGGGDGVVSLAPSFTLTLGQVLQRA